jgi:(1->4)-alpha-D-glucan 1-alpha-D-glucosylmutase
LIVRIPTASYRLQLSGRFRLADARAVVPYLEALGITDLYASPFLAARRGSPHGYDVTDPTRLNPEIGSEADLAALVRSLRRRRMGLIADVVPNHMAASSDNPWWSDVLEHGILSRYARFFDIDWHPRRWELQNRVLLPVLGEPYETCLRSGAIRLGIDPGGLHVTLQGMRLPIAVTTWGAVLEAAAAGAPTGRTPRAMVRRTRTGAVRRLRALGRRVDDLRRRLPTVPRARQGLSSESRRMKTALWRLYTTVPQARARIDRAIAVFNGRRGDRPSFAALHRLLDEQNYRLTSWRRAGEEINYRRFFNIVDLVSLRIEDPEVFAARHALLARLVRDGWVTGVRVDHVDGLFDPTAYLRRLRTLLGPAVPILVEKILAGDERLHPLWPVQGTTGYEFAALLGGLTLDAEGWRRLGDVYARCTGRRISFEALAREKKLWVMGRDFVRDLRALVRPLARLAETDRRTRALLSRDLARALSEVTASLPVYRTYVNSAPVRGADRRVISRAVAEARRATPGIPPACFAFVRRALLLEGSRPRAAVSAAATGVPGAARSAFRTRDLLAALMRWQQFTGPIMAKGVEDTALYAHNRLLSVNEVGGRPGRPVVGPQEFHRRLAGRRRRCPDAMSATMTHDSKRAEDVRARIGALAEIPGAWETRLRRWRRWNARHRTIVHGRPVPEPNEEILIYQTLLGAWPRPGHPLRRAERPRFRDRVAAFLVKAGRAAKEHTSWSSPDVEHERAVARYLDGLLAAPRGDRFLPDFIRFQERLAFAGAVTGLTQTLVKITAPGFPDFYQGSELWDLRLVDPDNRGPVDFRRRARSLARLRRAAGRDRAALARRLARHWRDGLIKMFTIWSALSLRRRHHHVFSRGDYLPLRVTGRSSTRVIAFARRAGGRWVVVVGPTHGAVPPPATGSLARPRTGTILLPGAAPARLVNVLTGARLAVRPARTGRRALALEEVLADFPVALLAGRCAPPRAARRARARR